MSPVNSQIITAIVFFILGNISGYVFHDVLKRALNFNDDMSKNLLILVVTFIWSIGMLVSVFNPQYSVPVPVHAIMGAIVGFFFYRPKQQ